MYKQNTKHEQMTMVSDWDHLPENIKKHLDNSWAPTFYKECFCKIDENLFKPLYSDKKSRPNTPINILFGLEMLKSGFGLSDEELYSEYLFNIKYRVALGLKDFNNDYFDLRTMYNFRSAAREYEKENDINLIKKAFASVTDKQLKAIGIKTNSQRMDSTLVESNIRNMGRLQLLVEVINCMYKVLSEEAKEKHQDIFAEYVKEDSLHYCYKVRGEETGGRLAKLGIDIDKILVSLKESYENVQAYKNLFRVFEEHYKVKDKKIELRNNKELRGSNLQSPHDVEATYRRKGKESSKGYVANVSETCNKENKVQLITNVTVETNITDDGELFAKDVGEINDRMELEDATTDGGYAGKKAEEASEKYNVKHKMTEVRGGKPSKDKLRLDDFEQTKDGAGKLVSLTCPNGQVGEVEENSADKFVAKFKAKGCEGCPLEKQCPTAKLARDEAVKVWRFNKRNVAACDKRKEVEANRKETISTRASVESTIRSVIHPFGGHLCQMRVRGKFRVGYMLILSAAMVNLRRIHLHNSKKGGIFCDLDYLRDWEVKKDFIIRAVYLMFAFHLMILCHREFASK